MLEIFFKKIGCPTQQELLIFLFLFFLQIAGFHINLINWWIIHCIQLITFYQIFVFRISSIRIVGGLLTFVTVSYSIKVIGMLKLYLFKNWFSNSTRTNWIFVWCLAWRKIASARTSVVFLFFLFFLFYRLLF